MITIKWLLFGILIGSFTSCSSSGITRYSKWPILISYHYDDPAKEAWNLELRDHTILIDDLEVDWAEFDIMRLKRHAGLRGGMAINITLSACDASSWKRFTDRAIILIEAANQAKASYRITLHSVKDKRGVSIRTSAIPEDGKKVYLKPHGFWIDSTRVEGKELIQFVASNLQRPSFHLFVSKEFLCSEGGYRFLSDLIAQLDRCDEYGMAFHLYALSITE
jgi:hypothetical protein